MVRLIIDSFIKLQVSIEIFDHAYLLSKCADTLVLAGNWIIYKELNLMHIFNNMRQKIILDGRILPKKEKLINIDFTYIDFVI